KQTSAHLIFNSYKRAHHSSSNSSQHLSLSLVFMLLKYQKKKSLSEEIFVRQTWQMKKQNQELLPA
ncbi:hypothetical protein GIB67_029880, partial [Kingdonia uniflora]